MKTHIVTVAGWRTAWQGESDVQLTFVFTHQCRDADEYARWSAYSQLPVGVWRGRLCHFYIFFCFLKPNPKCNCVTPVSRLGIQFFLCVEYVASAPTECQIHYCCLLFISLTCCLVIFLFDILRHVTSRGFLFHQGIYRMFLVPLQTRIQNHDEPCKKKSVEKI